MSSPTILPPKLRQNGSLHISHNTIARDLNNYYLPTNKTSSISRRKIPNEFLTSFLRLKLRQMAHPVLLVLPRNLTVSQFSCLSKTVAICRQLWPWIWGLRQMRRALFPAGLLRQRRPHLSSRVKSFTQVLYIKI